MSEEAVLHPRSQGRLWGGVRGVQGSRLRRHHHRSEGWGGDVGLLYSTDGSIAANGFVVLEDDKQLQAADNITPLVNEEAVNEEIIEPAERGQCRVGDRGDHRTNKRATVDVEDAADLAEEYLTELGLI